MHDLHEAEALSLLGTVHAEIVQGNVEMGLSRLCDGLNHIQARCTDDHWRTLAKEVIQSHPLMHILRQDPMTRHAYEKPRGYPGDAHLLDLIYHGVDDTFPIPREVDETARRVFKSLCRGPHCSSARARRDLLAYYVDRTTERVVKPRILAVAAGHLREARLSMALQRGAIGEWVALDQDVTSLQEIHSAQYEATGIIQPVHGRVRDLLKRTLDLGAFDLIYAAGLYDYLSDEIAVGLTEALFDRLQPGGCLLVANYSPFGKEHSYMDACMDWWLVRRGEQQMRSLTRTLPQQAIAAQRVFAEQEILWFLEVVKAGHPGHKAG